MVLLHLFGWWCPAKRNERCWEIKSGVFESVCLHNKFQKKTKQKEAYEAACFSTHLLRFHCTAFPYSKSHLNIKKKKKIILLDKLWDEKGKQDVCEQPLALRPWELPALPWSTGGEWGSEDGSREIILTENTSLGAGQMGPAPPCAAQEVLALCCLLCVFSQAFLGKKIKKII